MIVALDGPAGSGKSTTARLAAEALGFLYLDTGAMYRAVALAFLRAGVPITPETAETVLAGLNLHVEPGASGMRVWLNGEEVSEAIRAPEVAVAASRASALAPVREALVREQRRIGQAYAGTTGGLVIDGRDIGTVVFPEAEVKVFIVADPVERARRRQHELAARGEDQPLEAVLAEIRERDLRDTTRAIAPLRKAEDAVELDTTALEIDDQVRFVVDRVRERLRGFAV